MLEILVKCGLPKEIAFSKNPDLIYSKYPFQKGSEEYNIFFTYQFAIGQRYDLQNTPLRPLDKDLYNLNISDNEIIYNVIFLTTLYEEKTIRYDVTYSGLRWSSGLLRAGTISAIGNAIKDFVAQDIGMLFITNKRIIFIGQQQYITKSIKINEMLMYNLYQDGVLIRRANKKAILFKFDQSINYEIAEIGDGLNVFVNVLNRIINKTELMDLGNLQKKQMSIEEYIPIIEDDNDNDNNTSMQNQEQKPSENQSSTDNGCASAMLIISFIIGIILIIFGISIFLDT
jgi:hypothetical protein